MPVHSGKHRILRKKSQNQELAIHVSHVCRKKKMTRLISFNRNKD